MSRLLVLLFALLLPAQFAWSAAAAYCHHERAPAAAHFGHHEHVHLAKNQAGDQNPLAADADCGVCNAAHASPVIDLAVFEPLAPQRAQPADRAAGPPASALARAPDRPQWPRLA